MPSSESSDRGHYSERAAARKYGLVLDRDEPAIDARASNGTKYSIKSTTYERASGSYGRLRFWKDNFEQLPEGRSGVIVVVMPSAGSSSRAPLKIERVTRAEVADAIADRGGWNRSGHDRGSRQHRMPWTELVSYR